MGLVLGCFSASLASLGCCFTQAACRLCCNSCPTAKYSTATRVGYTLLMFVGVIFSYLTKAEFIKKWLVKIPSLCKDMDSANCMKVISEECIMRIWMTYAIFFFFMSIFTIDVRTSRDIRSMFHTGFWIFKLLILIGVTVGLSFVKIASQFSYTAVTLGFIGTIIFLLIQLVMVIDFVYIWNSSWTAKAEDTSSNVWYGGLFTFTSLMYMATFACIVVMYVFLAKSAESSCALQKTLTSLQLICCVIISLVAILPQVQDNIPSSGLLQASAIALYTTYQIFSALLNNNSICNHFVTNSNSTLSVAVSILSALFTLFMVTFSSLQNDDQTKTQMLGIQNSPNPDAGFSSTADKRDGTYGTGRAAQEVYDDEEDGVVYSYSLFHTMLTMCSLYMMMVLTNWYIPQNYTKGYLVAMWIRIVTGWCCHILYIWTLVAPMILTDRDFGYD